MRFNEICESGPVTTNIGQNLAAIGGAALAGVNRWTASDDQIDQMHLGDTRKKKITLKMLNRLKMIRASKKLEIVQKQKILGIMYGAKPEDEGGGLV